MSSQASVKVVGKCAHLPLVLQSREVSEGDVDFKSETSDLKESLGDSFVDIILGEWRFVDSALST
jgi:hypothetical protein